LKVQAQLVNGTTYDPHTAREAMQHSFIAQMQTPKFDAASSHAPLLVVRQGDVQLAVEAVPHGCRNIVRIVRGAQEHSLVDANHTVLVGETADRVRRKVHGRGESKVQGTTSNR
jgi:hypothetical protein